MKKERNNAIFNLSNMSHEMKTPLNVIIGMCDIARLHIDDRDRVKECLLKISVAGEHLNQMVSNILDISTIEQGKLRIKEEEFNIANLIDELKTLLEPAACEKSIILHLSDKEMVNKNLSGDYSHILHVMMNLATNAVKYTPQGGFVKLWVEEKENNNKDIVSCRFVCQDNGIGMSEDFLENIFQPFVRAEDPRIQKVGGVGLGMAIVHEIVKAMGGDIHIESIPDMGTKVTVEIDFKIGRGVCKINDLCAFREHNIQKIKDRKIILVADCCEESRQLTGTLLDEMGFETEFAVDGEETVDMFIESKEGFYKAILMDMEMPVMDGCQAALMIRGLNRSDSDIPIIAMTSHSLEEGKRESAKAGMNHCIIKLPEKDKLEEMLKSLMTESVAHR